MGVFGQPAVKVPKKIFLKILSIVVEKKRVSDLLKSQ